jgi:hypothetical protein
MVKIDHVTVVIPDDPIAMENALSMLTAMGMRLVEPDTQYAARNTQWKYNHLEDDNGFKVHVVCEGENDAKAGEPGLAHFRAVVTRETFERLTTCVYCERNAGSGRIWLRGPGTLRAEVITTAGLMPSKRGEFGVEVEGAEFIPSMGGILDDIPEDEGHALHLRRHKEIMERALNIMVERDPKYHDSWKNYGWRGAIFNMRRKAERVWHLMFNLDPNDLNTDTMHRDVDDLYDIINYATMAVQCIEDANRDGTDGWWKAD